MPKAPILSRELFYDKLNDGTMRLLDFCLVNTELGAMVEPRSVNMVGFSDGIPASLDIVGASFTRISEMKEDQFYSLTGTGGRQIPIDFTY